MQFNTEGDEGSPTVGIEEGEQGQHPAGAAALDSHTFLHTHSC